MTHPRERVRTAFADRVSGIPLLADDGDELTGDDGAPLMAVLGATLLARRVYRYRRHAVEGEAKTPCARIATPEDEAAGETIEDGSTPSMRRVRVECEAIVQKLDAAEDTLDAVCEQIEAAIDEDPTLGGVVEATIYRSTSVQDDLTGQRAVLVATMLFDVYL